MFDMPQIPFEVYHIEYNKTVRVVAGCEKDPKTNVLYFKIDDSNIKNVVFEAVDKAFDQPGIVKIKVCRYE